MLTDEDITRIITRAIKPLKEMVEVTQSKVSRIDAYQGVMRIEVRSIKDQLSVVNEKIDVGFNTLDEKIEGVLEFAHNIEKERHKNARRLEKIEEKLEISTN